MKTTFKFTLLLALLSASVLLSAQTIECFVIAPPEKSRRAGYIHH